MTSRSAVAAPAPPEPVRIGVPADPAVRVALSLRGRGSDGGIGRGNVSLALGDRSERVIAARRALLHAVGSDLEHAVLAEQVHGAGVARVGRRDRGRGAHDHAQVLPGVDALVTTDSEVALAVLVADCVPVVLVDPGRAVAVAHAGRRGVAAEVVPATVAALLTATGGTAERLAAVLGPAIGGCCYEVPQDMADDMAAAIPSARAETRAGAPGLDLPAAVRAQLAEAGVAEVTRVGGCTACEDAEQRFSHRASGGSGRPAGRQAMVVVRHDPVRRDPVRRQQGGAPADAGAVTDLSAGGR